MYEFAFVSLTKVEPSRNYKKDFKSAPHFRSMPSLNRIKTQITYKSFYKIYKKSNDHDIYCFVNFLSDSMLKSMPNSCFKLSSSESRLSILLSHFSDSSMVSKAYKSFDFSAKKRSVKESTVALANVFSKLE